MLLTLRIVHDALSDISARREKERLTPRARREVLGDSRLAPLGDSANSVCLCGVLRSSSRTLARRPMSPPRKARQRPVAVCAEDGSGALRCARRPAAVASVRPGPPGRRVTRAWPRGS